MQPTEHFSVSELACPCCGRNECVDALPVAMEQFRAVVDRAVVPDSGYRCEVHNAKVGGAKNSQHRLGNAADVVTNPAMSPHQMYQAALKVPAFAAGGLGVSLKPDGYIHMDIRTGGPRRWCYDLAGKECPWDPKFDVPLEAIT